MKQATKEEIKNLALKASEKVIDVIFDVLESSILTDWVSYGIEIKRLEFADRVEVHIEPASDKDCDYIRFKSITAILGNDKFIFPYHKYGLDLVREMKLAFKVSAACKRVNKIKAFL